ncbi:hypothetical protein HG530_013759 [Fusarium avenaceum]|nr:hypothetical protein HG530_013759 [Fusarium avenaceum]
MLHACLETKSTNAQSLLVTRLAVGASAAETVQVNFEATDTLRAGWLLSAADGHLLLLGGLDRCRGLLLKTHGSEEGNGLGGSNVENAGKSLKGLGGVEEGDTGTAGNNIGDGAGGFGADAVGDLSLDEGHGGNETGVERGRDGEEGPGAVTVVVRKVVGDISVDGVCLHQLRGQRGRVSVGADEGNVAGAADAVGGEASGVGTADIGESDGSGLDVEELEGLVDGVLSHLSVCGPLSSGAGEEAGGRGCNEVASDEGFGVLRVGVLDESSQNVLARQSRVGVQKLADLSENEVNVVLLRDRCTLDLAGVVGGTGKSVSLPGKNKDNTAVRGGSVEETKTVGADALGEHDVHAGGGSDDGLARGVVHLVDGVGEGTGSVDDTLGADLEGADDLAVGILVKTCHLNVVENGSTVMRSSKSESDVHSGVVVLAIVVNQGTNHALLAQKRERLEGLVLAHPVRALETLGASEEIVGLGAGPEVSHTTVYKLRALGAGAGRKVIALDEGNLEAAGDGVNSDTGSGSTAADDEQVVFCVLVGLGAASQLGEGLSA